MAVVVPVNKDLEEARGLANAALPGLVTRMTERLMASDDVEDIRKGIETTLRVIDPPKRDDGKASLPTFNLVIGLQGVTATPVASVEVVEEAVVVQPKQLEHAEPEEPATGELADLLAALNLNADL